MHFISTPQRQYLFLYTHQPASSKTGVGQLSNSKTQLLLSSVPCRGSAVPLQCSPLSAVQFPLHLAPCCSADLLLPPEKEEAYKIFFTSSSSQLKARVFREWELYS